MNESASGGASDASSLDPERIRRLERRSLGGYLGIVAVDAAGVIRYASESLDGVFGLAVGEVEGRSFLDFLHPGDVDQAVESFAGVAERVGHHQVLTVRLIGSDGRESEVDAVADNGLEDPDVGVVVLNLADPRDRRRSAQLLGIQAEVVRQVAVGASLDAAVLEVLRFVETALPGFAAAAYLFESDAGGSLGFAPTLPTDLVNAQWEALNRRREPGIAVDTTDGVVPGALSLRDEEVVIAADLSEQQWLPTSIPAAADWRSCWSVPVRFGREDSVRGLIEIYGPHAAHPSDEDWTVLDLSSRMVATAIDNTVMRSNMLRDATTDELTGLPNRRVIGERLEAIMSSPAAGHVVCFIDLDNLKVVNDGLGHEAGDLVICEAANRLAAAIGNIGVLGRFGGDEFVAIVPATQGPVDHEELAERLLATFADTIQTGDRAWSMTASIGVVITKNQSSRGEVLRDADAAMYMAKRGGRNRWHLFRPQTRDHAHDRMRLEYLLREAVDNRSIDAWFQPVVRTADWSIMGLEALARWQLDDGTWIAPDQFIPLCEEIGVMDELGVQMLDRAAGAVDACLAHHLSLDQVSVNVSPTQLRTERLFEHLDHLSDAGHRVDELCIEITEQHIVDDSDLTQSRLERIRSGGPSLAVDDFGTGYSSLASLHRIPAETLKIDRALVAQSHVPSGLAVLRSIVGVAEAFGLHVVAEGVETVEQALCLRDLGVPAQQGFLFARPRPLDETMARVSTSGWFWDVDESELAASAQ